MMKIFRKKNKKDQGGFVVLFSMLVSSLILMISSGIYTIVQKQVILASYSKESQKAFYTADSALDCALYHDLVPKKTAFPPEDGAPSTQNIECGGGVMDVEKLGVTTGSSDDGEIFSYPYIFRYHGASRNNRVGCAYVLVEKEKTGSLISTRITAAGFNVCTPDGEGRYVYPDVQNPTLVERRVSASYRLNFVVSNPPVPGP